MSRLGGSAFTELVPVRNADRRKCVRYPCSSEITCRIFTDDHEDFWAIRLQNISEGGIKLILDRFIGSGELAMVEIYNASRKIALQRHVQVLFTFEDLHGNVVLGGSFMPELNGTELENLL